MKAFVAIICSVFILLTTMQQATFLLIYKLDEKNITEQYCINKDVKNSCCHGSCHMNKTIMKAEKDDSKNPLSSSNFKLREIEIFFQQAIKLTFQSYNQTAVYISLYNDGIQNGYSSDLIKPPLILG